MAQDLVKVAAALALCCAAQLASAGRIVNENFLSDDSEDARQHAHYLGYQWRPAAFSEPDRLSFWYGQWLLDDPAGSAHFSALRATYETRLPARTTLNLRATALDSADWTTWSGALSVASELGERWRVEVSAERDLIDSVPAIRQRLTGKTYTASADFRAAADWTLVGALLLQDISDSNQRRGGVFRLIYSPSALPGLSLQTKSRLIESDFDGAGYFSPPELQEHLLLIGYATSFASDRWAASGLVGPGTQHFEDGFGGSTNQTIFYGELKLRGWFNDHFGLESRGFCTNTGGPNTGVPNDDYRYCSALLSLIGAW